MNGETRLAVVRSEMRGFLQFGLFEDPVATARELRRIRTEITRTIEALEKRAVWEAANPPVPEDEGVDRACGGSC